MNLNFLMSISVLINLNFSSLSSSLNIKTAKQTDTNFSDLYSNKTILLSQQSDADVPIVSTRGFDFEFTGCNMFSSDELICSFLVRNNQQPRNLSLWPDKSRIIDKEGNVILGEVAQLGAMGILGGRTLESEELPTQAPISGKVLFRVSGITAGNEMEFRHIEFNFGEFYIWFSQGD